MSRLRRSHFHQTHLLILRVLFVLCSIAFVALCPYLKSLDASRFVASSTDKTTAASNDTYGKLPLSFEANEGQTDPAVKFLSRGRGYNLFLTQNEAVLTLSKFSKSDANAEGDMTEGATSRRSHIGVTDEQTASVPGATLRMKLVGANSTPRVEGLERLPGKSNYLVGKDQQNWHTGIVNYAKVKYAAVYPGVDLVYYGNQRQLEYDLVVGPGSDPMDIGISFEGAEKLSINEQGQLVLQVAGGELSLLKPVVYQEIGGVRREVPGAYALRSDRQVSFQIGDYDRSRQLVIDPILSYSTYIGGTSDDFGRSIAVDAAGQVYITGSTASADFPTLGSQQSLGGDFDIFVTKLNAAGSAVLYSTFLGGSNSDNGNGIAVDASGNVFITGSTDSYNFPVSAGAFQAVKAGGNPYFKSTDGGTSWGLRNGLTPAGIGSFAFQPGNPSIMFASSFNGAGIYKSTDGGDNWVPSNTGLTRRFINNVVINPTNPQILYAGVPDSPGVNKSTDGGNNWFTPPNSGLTSVLVNAMVADPTSPSTLYVGTFDGGVFKSTNAANNWIAVNNGLTDLGAFSLAIDPSNPQTLYAGTPSGVFKTTNGGASWTVSHSFITDNDYALAVSPTNTSIVYSASAGALFRSTNAGGNWTQVLPPSNVSTVGIDPINSSVVYAGSFGQGVRKSTDGGNTWNSTGLTNGFVHNVVVHPTNPALVYTGDFTGTDAFVAKLNDTGSALLYSTYLGGGNVGGSDLSNTDGGRGIVVDASGSAYVTGFTLSSDFPTRNPLQPNYGGSRDAFVAKLNPNASGNQSLVYSTYLGGNNLDEAFGIAVDTSGNVYVAGRTFSLNFPTRNALQNTFGGASDAFVTKYDPTGSSYVYSTYLGGSATDQARGIAVDSAGNAYVTGFTFSGTVGVPNSPGAFPTNNALQSSRAGGSDAFVTKLNATGTAPLVYSTYLGGSANEQGLGIAVDSGGRCYVTGFTLSGTANTVNSPGAFPTVNALQRSRAGGSDAFVSKLDGSGTALVYSTYLGGGNTDQANGIAVDGTGKAYVVGQTFSTNFPTTPGAFRQFSFNFNGNISEGFVSKIDESVNGFSITGRLTTNTGVPIAGGVVNLVSGANFVNSTQSDSNGFYQFLSLLPGTYTVTPDPHTGSAGNASSFSYTPPSRTFTNVSTDQTADFTGTPTYSIFVFVTDETTGFFIRGVTVTLTGSSSATAVTDCDGTVSFPDLQQGGNYTITPSFGNAIFTPPNITFTNLNASQFQSFTTSSVNFFTVGGRVTDGSGNGLAGVTISSTTLSQCLTESSTETDVNGNYIFAGLQQGGSYRFIAAKPGLTFSPEGPIINNLSSTQTLNFTSSAATGLNGKIAFASSAGQGDSEIFVVNADGSGETDVTNNPASDRQPAWSPDGTRLSFLSDRGGNLVDDVYILNANGGVSRVTNDSLDKDGPTWSPDGTRLAYASGDCSSNPDPQSIPDIYLIQLDGGNRSRLTNDSFTDFAAAWSPNGTKIAFNKSTLSDCSGANTDIYAIDPAGNNVTRLTNQPGSTRPSWSPDGTKIAFAHEALDSNTNSLITNIWVMNADGSGQTQITHMSYANEPTWSPDGNRIAFAASLAGVNGIFAINSNGTGLVQITSNQAGFSSTPAWAPAPNSQGKTISGRVTDNNNQGLSAATLTLTGSHSASVTTDTNGRYFFTEPANGNYTVTPSRAGFSFNPPSLTFNNLTADQTANFTGSTASATDVFWINAAGGTWNTAANWRDGAGANRVPAANDNVFIDLAGTYTVTLNVTATINSLTLGATGGTQSLITGGFGLTLNGDSSVNPTGVLTLSGGTLSGAGNLNINGTLNWTNGSMSGTGVTNIVSGATLNLTNNGTNTFLARTLNNAGTTIYTGTGGGNFLFNGGTFNNQAGGLFDVRADKDLLLNSGTNLFTNPGTFRKSAGTVTTQVSVPLNNTGTVEVQTGTVNLSNGGTSSGAFNVSPGGTLQFGGGTHTLQASSNINAANAAVSFSGGTVNLAGSYNAGTTTTVAGIVNFTGNVINLGGALTITGTANFNSNAISLSTLNLNGGTLGGSADISITGTAAWTNGQMTGTGVTNITSQATLNLTNNGTNTFLARTLNNAGSAIYTGTGGGNFLFNGGTFNNQAGGLFDVRADKDLLLNSGTNLFSNAGTFRKTGGTTTTQISAPFNNTGTVELQAGTLQLSNTGTGGGNFNLSPNTTLQFSGGTYTLDSSSSISAPNATLIFSSTVNINGSYNAATTNITGTANFNSNVTLPTVNLSGTLGGSGTLSIPAGATVNWTNGTMGGTGVTNIASGATLNLTNNGTNTFLARTLNNAGTTIYTGTGGGNFLFNGGTFNNQTTGLFDVRADKDLLLNSGTNLFSNAGTFRKSAGTATTQISAPFNNTSIVEVQTGTLQLSNTGTSGGTFNLTPGTTLQFSSGTYTLNAGSSINASGATVILGSIVNVNGSYNAATTNITGTANFNSNLTLPTVNLSGTVGGSGTITIPAGGTLNWTNGTMVGTGVTNISSGASLNLTNDGTNTFLARTLNNSGTAIYTGTGGGNFLFNGATFNNQVNGVFQVTADKSLLLNSGTNLFSNAGTLRKSAGTGTTQVSVPFSNSAVLEVQTGTISFTNSFTQTAGSTFLNGGNLSTNSSLNIQAGTLNGAGNITGNVSNGGTVRPGTSPGCLSITGNYTQTATGTLVIEVGGLTSCLQFDRLAITGVATLAGALNTSLINGFVPTPSDSFQVMTFASRNGTFNSVNGPLSANYTGTNVILGNIATATFTISGHIADPSNTSLAGVTVNLTGAGTASTTTDSNGDYSFPGLASGGNNTVTPSRANFTFIPPSQSFNNLMGDQTANFTGSPNGIVVNNYVIAQTSNGVIVPGTTDINNHCDDCTTNLALPFPISLYDRTFSAANISSNGVIQFSGNSSRFSNSCLPIGDVNFDYTILGYWDDLRTDAANIPGLGRSGIFTSVTGTAPNRIFNMEWRSTFFNNGNQAINFEIRLYESQPRFDVIYAQIDQFGSSATVGVQRTASSGFTQYECNTGGLTPNLALSFTGSDQLFVSGLVTQTNGAGVSGTIVTLSGSASASVTTDSSGFYSFGNLAAGGNYTVTPSRAGFTFNPPNRTFNNLTTNQIANFTAAPTGFSISGHITDGSLNLSGVLVTLSGSGSATSTTDANGNYSFANLAAGGSYAVTPSRQSTVFTPPSQTFTNLSSNVVANFVGMTTTLFSISGHVTNSATSQGVNGVTITLSGSQSSTTTTDSNGNYSFTAASGGTYTILPSKVGFTFVPPNRTITNLTTDQTADFVGTREASVSTPAGTNVTVQLEDIAITFASVSTAGITTLRHISFNSAGTPPIGYTFFDTEAIDLSTTATVSGPINLCTTINNVDDPAVFARLRVLHGEDGVLVDRTSSSNFSTRGICANVNSLSPFALALVQLQTISGHVDSAGANLEGVTMTLSGTQSGVTTTGPNGNYSFTIVRGGTYVVTPSRTNFVFSPQSLPFANLSGDVTGANFTGSLVNFSISGRVADASGTGITSVNMTLAGAGAQTITTDTNGNYSFPQVAADGNYTLSPTKFGFNFTPASQSYSNLQSNQVQNFVATAVPNPTPTPTPNEDFNGGTPGPNFTPGTLTTTPSSNNPNVTVTVENGQLVITPVGGANGSNFNGIVLVKPIDLNVTPTVRCEIVSVPTEEGALTTFGLGNDPNNWYRFAAGTNDGLTTPSARNARANSNATTPMLFFQTNLGGTKFSTGIPFDPVGHRFWRFRFDVAAQTINFETSPDASVWTLRYTSNISKPVTGLVAELSAGTVQPAAHPSKAIFDNFVVSSESLPVNRVDQTDFFVHQQYLDFLNREPDPGGLAFWINEIARCGNNPNCINLRRVDVSAAFFIENEFQQTGSFVYLLYKASFNRRLNFAEFQSDRSGLVVGPNLESTKQALAIDFVTRPAFKNIFDRLGSVEYVDALFANAGVTPTPEERAAFVIGLLTGRETRATVLLKIAENQAFAQREYNSAFVLMQYFGYLRRDPDPAGFLFWLDVLNNRERNNYRGMVCAFITSPEYQLRFGSTVTRTNANCGQ